MGEPDTIHVIIGDKGFQLVFIEVRKTVENATSDGFWSNFSGAAFCLLHQLVGFLFSSLAGYKNVAVRSPVRPRYDAKYRSRSYHWVGRQNFRVYVAKRISSQPSHSTFAGQDVRVNLFWNSRLINGVNVTNRRGRLYV